MIHPLTNKIRSIWKSKSGSFITEIDQLIVDWLKEKAKNIIEYNGQDNIREILELKTRSWCIHIIAKKDGWSMDNQCIPNLWRSCPICEAKRPQKGIT